LLQAADEEFAFVDHFFWETVVELDEELFVFDDFAAPGFAAEILELVEFFLGEIEAAPFHIFVIGHPADGSFAALGADARAIDDPFQHAHIFAVARPDKLAFGIFAEPIDVKNAGSDAERALHLDPMAEIIAHVITAEREHGHGIAANFADGAGGGGGHFRAHGGADVYAGAPIEGLVDQRHGGGAASAKNESVQRNAMGI